MSEYHTGYRAYRREALEAVNLETNSDNFLFDQEIIAQFIDSGMRIREVPVPARYFVEASSATFLQSSVYGLSILQLLARYLLHRAGLHQRHAQVTVRLQNTSDLGAMSLDALIERLKQQIIDKK